MPASLRGAAGRTPPHIGGVELGHAVQQPRIEGFLQTIPGGLHHAQHFRVLLSVLEAEEALVGRGDRRDGVLGFGMLPGNIHAGLLREAHEVDGILVSVVGLDAEHIGDLHRRLVLVLCAEQIAHFEHREAVVDSAGHFQVLALILGDEYLHRHLPVEAEVLSVDQRHLEIVDLHRIEGLHNLVELTAPALDIPLSSLINSDVLGVD